MQPAKKLRDLPISDRASTLGLGEKALKDLRAGLALDTADQMIENVIGTYALPMGVAQNFVVNGRPVPAIPMVIEEASVVAACSFAAKLARETGGFKAGSSAPVMIGQIQVLDVPDIEAARARILAESSTLLEWLNRENKSTISAHARAVGLEIRILTESALASQFLVVHVLYDCGDAMGANLVNTACEALAPRIAQLTQGRVNLRILSNLSDERLAWAECRISGASLENQPRLTSGVTADASVVDAYSPGNAHAPRGDSDPASGHAAGNIASDTVRNMTIQSIVAASRFAELDPYRAATSNKGVMNGIDAVVIATGNDWRAVEAGAHAYAARTGRYTSLTTWRANDAGDLVGQIALPLAVGIVGGATRVHPGAQVALKLLGVKTARELAEIIACVGLAQNFAAIRALATEGIQAGHMALHARQIAAAAGATGEQIERIAAQLVAERNVRLERARVIMTNQEQTR